MLAADRSLLEVNLRQSAIKLREKELNLYTENFSAMATQAAVIAGFTTTCLIEIHLPADTTDLAKNFLYVPGIISICANITCVSLATITIIWGSGKALRGKEGSMDEAVEGISNERARIFNSFALGLAGNLVTVMASCIIIMKPPVSYFAIFIVLYTGTIIAIGANRIQKKFQLIETVHLDDLTNYSTGGRSGGGAGNNSSSSHTHLTSLLTRSKSPEDYV